MKLFNLEAIATSNSVKSLSFGVLIIVVAAVGTHHSSGFFLGLGFLTVLVCAVMFSAPKKLTRKTRIEPSLDLDQEAGPDYCGYQIKEAAIDLVQKVGKRLTRAAGLPDDSISFFVTQDLAIGGYAVASKKFIAITYGLLMDCRSEDELAAVLGHEIGHLVSSKIKDPNASGEQKSIRLKHLKEYKADRFSIRLMQKAGYSPDALGRTLWRQMSYHLKRGDRFAFDDSQSDHPSPLKRIFAMNRATT
jgi:Zn-dependent protease with chaperone function